MPDAALLDRQRPVLRAPCDPHRDAEVVPRGSVVALLEMRDECIEDAAVSGALDQVVGRLGRHALGVRDQVAKRKLAQAWLACQKPRVACCPGARTMRALEDEARAPRGLVALPAERRRQRYQT